VPERRFTILDPAGLHARPAARFVQVASRFASRIVIRYGDREADAKSLIALLGLTVRPSTQISLAAEGSDAEVALNALVEELAPYISLADTESAAFVPSVGAKPATNS
jgi:phosphotransferase system HPr (HPr) family protein